MKVIIAGSRDFYDYNFLVNKIRESGMKITTVVSGGAKGVDSLGESYSRLSGITLKVFPADWGTLGKSAGFIRNKQMADYADALICIRVNHSKGSTHMIKTMVEKGRKYF